MATQFELEDIQALILTGHGHLNHSCFLLLRVTDAAGAKKWLRRILGEVATARRRTKAEVKPLTAVQIGFSSEGLRALGLPEDSLKTFSLEFQEGIAEEQRAWILGDTGESAPEKWVWGGSASNVPHIVLMVYAKDAGILEERRAGLRRGIQEAEGLREIACEGSVVPESREEPFGFRDGITQPAVEGSDHKEIPGQETVKAGEFLLGYANEYEKLPFTPTVPKALDPASTLAGVPGDPTRRDLGRNGSYLVFRKLSQDVSGFWKYFREQAETLYGTREQATVTRLAAECVGRWPSGAPLVLTPDKEDRELGGDEKRNDNFKYADADPQGFHCPVGAHIRRCNPRDSITADKKESEKVARRHRIIRRGRPYQDLDAATRKIAEQGIFFMAINTDLRRQFEFIQQTWMNNPKFGGLYNGKDPVAGDNDGTSTMTIPAHPVREQLNNLPRFVQTRAGGYFFLPGMRALRFLANLAEPPISNSIPPGER